MSAQVSLTQEEIETLAEGLRINVTLYVEGDEDDIWLNGSDFDEEQIDMLRSGETVEIDELTLIPEADDEE